MDADRPWDRGRFDLSWYEVIEAYDERFFSEEIDSLVWQIYSLGGFDHDFPPDLERSLRRAFPDYGKGEALPPDVGARLRLIRDELRTRVRERGWHPDPDSPSSERRWPSDTHESGEP